MNQSIHHSIDRVIHNLRPQTAIDGQYGPPQCLEDRLQHYHTPGTSIAVINDFNIEWARGFGYCETGKPDRVTPSTVFQASSISKPIFALAIMRLVDQGRLDLDQDVNTVLNSWRIPCSGDWQPRITLRQLLSHSAGLTTHSFPGYQTSEPLPNLHQILSGHPPAVTEPVEVNILPGLQCRYSGGGTLVGQQILVDLMGQPFPDIMRTYVLNPLGMTDSTYLQPLPDEWAARAATAHPWKGVPLQGKNHIYPEMAAAGLWTTATDLARVGVEMLNGLNGRPARLLPKDKMEMMLSPQLPGASPGGGEYIGLEFFCNGSGNSFHFGCPGWNEGFMAIMRFYRQLGKGAVVMLNSNEGFPLFDEILRAIARAYEWPDVVPHKKVPAGLKTIDAFSGDYTTESGVTFQITHHDGTAQLAMLDQPPLPLMQISELEFTTGVTNTTIAFKKEGHRMAEMIVRQAGHSMRAFRQA